LAVSRSLRKKCICALLALTTFSSSAFGAVSSNTPASGCETLLFDQFSETNVEGLSKGERVYANPPQSYTHFQLDPQTAADIKIEKAAALLDPYLHSDLARMRYRNKLLNPMLNLDLLRREQKIIQAMAAHSEKFNLYRKHLDAIKKTSAQVLQAFVTLQEDKSNLGMDKLKATLTWLAMVVPMIIENIFRFLKVIHNIITGGGTGLGYSNALILKEKRQTLIPFRDQMVSAKLAKNALKDADLVPEVQALLASLSEGPMESPLAERWVKIHALMAPDDRDLPESVPVPAHESGAEKGLRKLHLALRLLQKQWKIPMPWKVNKERFQYIFDITLYSDRLFFSNFALPKIQNLIKKNEQALARILAGIADVEVWLAEADRYNAENARGQRMVFPKIMDFDEPTQFVARGLKHPVLAGHLKPDGQRPRPEDVIGHDVNLGVGNNRFTVPFSTPGGGAGIYAEEILLSQIMAQTGGPIYAESAQLTPGVSISAMDLRATMNGTKKSFTDIELDRFEQIAQLSESYEHSFVYISNPFTEAGPNTGISMRVGLLEDLMDLKTVGVMTTRDRTMMLEIKNKDDIEKLIFEKFVARPFDYDRDKESLKPDKYFAEVEKRPHLRRVLSTARRVYQELEKPLVRYEGR
jgi:hypothetical protein